MGYLSQKKKHARESRFLYAATIIFCLLTLFLFLPENFLIQQFSPIAIFTGFNYTFGKNKQEGCKFLQLKSFEYNYKYFSSMFL